VCLVCEHERNERIIPGALCALKGDEACGDLLENGVRGGKGADA